MLAIESTTTKKKKTVKKNNYLNKVLAESKPYREIKLFDVINISLVGNTNLDFKNIRKIILSTFGSKLFYNVDIIYLYNLNNPDIKAYFDGGMIVINLGLVKDDKDFVKTLLHEVIHSILSEVKQSESMEPVVSEYLRKRGKVLNKLLTYANSEHKYDSSYTNIEHDENFESYLKNDITFQIVYPISHIYFPSPYAITSIDEYLCIGFEIYFLEKREWLKEYCPCLFNFIEKTIGEI